MAKKGRILYTKKNFTDAEVQQEFGFPCILILHDNTSVIKKITAFDKIGTKTIYDFSLAATKDFVIQSIADAVAGLNDNVLEFNSYSDFPQPGEVGNIYIALDVDQIFVWNTESQSYVQQSWDAYIIQQLQTNIASAQMAFQNLENSKLDKGTYTGTASDLYLNDQNLLQSLQNEQSARYYADQGLENSKQNKLETVSGNTGVGKTDASATEKFDIAGRSKSDGQVFNETTSAILPREIKFKDGKFKAALADGVEKSIAFEGESSSLLITEGVYNENVVVNVQSVDYTTGIITTVGNHGFSEGDPLYIFPNSCLDFVNNNSTYERDLKSIPYEWVSQGLKVHVISSTQIQVYNGSNALISVNQTSTENNGNLTTPYYHFQKINPTTKNWLQIPKGHKRVKIVVYMFTGGYWVYRHLLMPIWQGNTFVFSNYNVPGVDFMGKNGASTLAALPVKQSIFSILEIEWNAESRLGTYRVVENYYYRNTGVFTITATKVNQQDTTIAIAPNDGIAGIGALIQNFIANGTIIKIYKA